MRYILAAFLCLFFFSASRCDAAYAEYDSYESPRGSVNYAYQGECEDEEEEDASIEVISGCPYKDNTESESPSDEPEGSTPDDSDDDCDE